MILAAGLTPAWQQIVLLDRLTLNAVNRARQVHWCAAGKVLNVGRALHQLGAHATTLTVAGGQTGAALRQELRDLALNARWIDSSRPTRVCTTILDHTRRTTTELVENSAHLPDHELDAFRAAFNQEIAGADRVILTGSLPEGTPPNLYADILRAFHGQTILDLRGPELLHALACHPFLVKPNREELARTFARPLGSQQKVLDAMRQVNARGAEWVVVTDGQQPVLVTHAHETFTLSPPLIQPVVNPIGCGDAMTAGIAWALDQGTPPLDAIRLGMAAAASSLTTLQPARLGQEPLEELAARIDARRL